MIKGRKRKAGRRQPNGRLALDPSTTRPTSETLHRKIMLVGDPDKIDMADCAINIMRARSLISEAEQFAAKRLEVLYRHRYGRTSPQSTMIGMLPEGRTLTDEAVLEERDRDKTDEYRRLVLPMTRDELRAVVAVVVYDEWPDYLRACVRRDMPTVSAVEKFEALRVALKKLAREHATSRVVK